jgi:hypothetical protein
MPLVTKWLFALSFGLTLGANFGLVDPKYIVLWWQPVFQNFEVGVKLHIIDRWS